ncbi:taste receptor type 2 member 119-like [Ascaphus truei]|uniref:taste receptor type 2 member 119-like n=1 Tax=Ascaphus truei TaxID=8439 RepID=UPI003F59EFA1
MAEEVGTHIYVFYAIYAAEIAAGILSNAFIVCVNSLDWINGKRLNSCDLNMFALGLSNAGQSCFSGLFISSSFLYPQIFMVNYVFEAVYALSIFTSLSSSWLTACLCLFYCVKIIHFKSGPLAWLKMKIDTVLPWLILVAEVISFTCSFSGIWAFTKLFPKNDTTALRGNISSKAAEFQKNTRHIVSFFIPSIILPFLIVLGTTIGIMWSLCRHTRQMKQKMAVASSSLKIHRRATGTMMGLLVLYLSFYVANVLLTIGILTGVEIWGIVILVLAFSPVESVLLILGNSKLKQNCHKLSHLMLCKGRH